MNTKKSKIVRHTSIYMLGDILRHSVSIIMLPIYTRFLTPEDYGVLELLSMIIDLASIIFGARVAQAVFRYYCSSQDVDERANIISSALVLGVLFNGIGALAVAFMSDYLAMFVFSDQSYSTYIMLFAVTMFLLPFVEIPLVYIRVQGKPNLFVFFSIMKLLLQVSFNIYFVVILEMHVTGVVYSAIMSAGLMAIILMVYTLPKTGIKAKLDICKNLFSFSLPLKLATIGSFYMTFGDRYFIKLYTDLSQVGIYSLGYKFGFIFTLIAWNPFEKTWDSEKYAVYNTDDPRSVYQKIFVYISVGLVLIGLAISLLAKDVIRIMAAPAFLDAYKIVPVIIIAYILQAWSKYCDLGILLKKKTIYIAYAEFIAVLCITGAYLLLIPRFGVAGAAWATVVGFFVRFYLVNKKGSELYNMGLPWLRVGLLALVAVTLFMASLFAPDQLLLSILSRLILLFIFVVAIFMLPILTKQEKETIYAKLYNISFIKSLLRNRGRDVA